MVEINNFSPLLPTWAKSPAKKVRQRRKLPEKREPEQQGRKRRADGQRIDEVV